MHGFKWPIIPARIVCGYVHMYPAYQISTPLYAVHACMHATGGCLSFFLFRHSCSEAIYGNIKGVCVEGVCRGLRGTPETFSRSE